MIIIDMNQISLASVMMDMRMRKSDELDEGMIRHMILNSIRLYRTQFNKEYGEVVLTYDSRHYWRREYFPQYKASRKKGRENDKEFKDHYPASGLIEFMYGEKADFRSDNLKFKPEVGTMLVFPSWLKHSVYPFYVDGERRSMSFNAYHILK